MSLFDSQAAIASPGNPAVSPRGKEARPGFSHPHGLHPPKALAAVIAALALPALAADFFWDEPAGGSFRNFSLWNPPSSLGGFAPGDSDDTANFNLGVSPRNRYTVTDVRGENHQLLIHSDAVRLDLGLNSCYLRSQTVGEPGMVVGVNDGDAADATVTGEYAAAIRAPDGQVVIGRRPAASGLLTILGAGLKEWGSLTVGQFGNGALHVTGGGTVSAPDGFAYLAFAGGSTATMSVQGDGSEFAANRLYVGGSSSLPGGTASLTVANNGTVQLRRPVGSSSSEDGTLRIWDDGAVRLDGGSLEAVTLINEGALDWQSGELRTRFVTIAPPSEFIFPPPPFGGDLVLSEGMRLTLNVRAEGILSIFNGGHLSIEGGELITRELDVNEGTIEFKSGLLQLLNTGLSIDPGQPLTGTRVLSGASDLVVGNLDVLGRFRGWELSVGGESAGVLEVFSGAEVRAGNLILGDQSSADGQMVVDGAGSRLATGNALDGTIVIIGREGAGSLIVSRGARVEEVVYPEGSNQTNAVVIGQERGSRGSLFIADANTEWALTNMVAGQFGAAAVTVSNGAALSPTAFETAVEPESDVTLVINGQGSLLDLVALPETPQLGRRGNVALVITNAGQLQSGSLILAEGASSKTSATVVGEGSSCLIGGDLHIGYAGMATAAVTDGAVVSNAMASMGKLSGSSGSMVVSGTGSSWTNSSRLYVGDAGEGALSIQSGGTVASGNSFIAALSGSEGEVIVTGTGSLWTVDGVLSIGGSAFTGENGGTGTVTVGTGGSVVSSGVIRLFTDGLLELNGGSLAAPGIDLRNGGKFTWTSGTVRIDSFDGELVNEGGVFAAGYSTNVTSILGDYAQHSGAILRIGISGNEPDEVGGLIVENNVVLDGAVEVTFAEGFEPSPGDSFTIIETTAGGIAGEFDELVAPPSDELAIEVVYQPQRVSIEVTEALAVPPALATMFSETNGLAVSWPAIPGGFVLQTNDNIRTTNWGNYIGDVFDDGTNRFIIIDSPEGNGFFRLIKP